MAKDFSPNTGHGAHISVVIPHLNQPQMLVRCLRSIFDGHRPPDEVIVVDNGSSRLPVAELAAFPAVRLLQERTPGPGPARNLGVTVAKGEILAFIDADCIADPGWLAAAETAMRDPGAEILGGDVRIALANPARLTVLEAYESIYAYRMDRYIAEQGFTGTGNLVVRRSVLDRVGPFAGLNMAEDRDWGHRATAKGFSIRYLAAMRVYHPAREDFAGLFAKWDRQLGHDYTLARQRGKRGILLWAAKTAAMGLSPLAELPRILTSDRISGSRSRLLALWGVLRIRLYRAVRMLWLLCGGNPDALSGRWNRT